jgi:uncharacterized protein
MLIDEIVGKPTLLCDWFDVIGGTSTGAISASALALGYRAADINVFYWQLGPKVFRFRHSFWRIAGFRAKFSAANVAAELDGIIGDRTLESRDLDGPLCRNEAAGHGQCWMLNE